jgi:protein TonB
MRSIRFILRFLLASMVLSLLLGQAGAARRAAVHSAGVLYLQESGTGVPLGKLNVAPQLMAGRCITMVSPAGDSPTPSTVIVRVVIWKSGKVSPMRVISGPASLQAEAMNAVRLWRYKPFVRDDGPVDVTTDIPVDFEPGKPGGLVTHPNH